MADIKTELPSDVRARLAELELELSEGNVPSSLLSERVRRCVARWR